jgi:transcriptional regulator with GAF, ATPase, and Fis domain
MQTKQIHIKATCENENRRFCISEAKFETLKQMISSLFSIESGNEFTVKYKDDENDLVTISSDDELAFAVNLFPTDILRIVIDFSKPKSELACDSACAEPKWHKKCKYPMDDEKRCHFLNAKRERILACLKELEGADAQASPKLLWKREHLQRKLQKLDSKIANRESANCGDNKHFGREHFDWKGPSDERRCHFLAAKKRKNSCSFKRIRNCGPPS